MGSGTDISEMAALSPAERWAWDKIRQGIAPDLAEFAPAETADNGGPRDDAWAKDWPEGRVLSPRFLEYILFHDAWSNQVATKSILIKNARFSGDDIDWSNQSTSCDIAFESCVFDCELHVSLSKFEKGVAFERTRFKSFVYFGTSSCQGDISFIGCRAEHDMHLLANQVGELQIDDCAIDGDMFAEDTLANGIRVSNSKFAKKLGLDGCSVRKLLKIENTEMEYLSVFSARIDLGIVFSECQVSEDVTFGETWVQGPVAIKNVQIRGALAASGLRASGWFNVTKLNASSLLLSKVSVSGLALDEFDVRQWVQGTGAVITGGFSVTNGKTGGVFQFDELSVGGAFLVRGVAFDDRASFDRAEISRGMTFDTVKCHGRLSLDRSRVSGTIEMHSVETGSEISMANLKCDMDILLFSLTAKESVCVNYCRIDGDIMMSDSKIGQFLGVQSEASGDIVINTCSIESDVNLQSSRLRGDLNVADSNCTNFEAIGLEAATASLNDSQVRGGANFDSCRIHRHFLLEGVKVTGLLCLGHAVIGGSVGTERCELESIEAHSIRVTSFVGFRRIAKVNNIGLQGAEVGSVQLRESVIHGEVDLSSAKIANELHFAKDAEKQGPVWNAGSRLVLRNASAGSIVGSIDAFRLAGGKGKRAFVPMDLTGFSFGRFGGLGAGNTLADATVDELLAWTASGHRRNVFTPDPYRHLGQRLEEAGHTQKGKRVLHAMRVHERRCEKLGITKLLLIGSGMFIGFGYRNEYVVGWFLALVLGSAAIGLNLVGKSMIDLSPAGFEEVFSWFWFSLGNAIPIITLDKAHETFLSEALNVSPSQVPVTLASIFYVEKLFGFLLLSYLVAGLSGLASRREK